ncbi:hypothetical protein A5876_003390, partial [Enterococcus sp. 3C8_DIV0646]
RLFLLMCLQLLAVSYTHLDVYKRQMLLLTSKMRKNKSWF